MFDLSNRDFLLMELFNKAQEGMIITDDKARILVCNDAFCRISGFTEEELIGNNPSILSSGRQDKDFYKDMWLSIEENGSWVGEVWNRKKDGTFYAELLSVNKVNIPGSDTVHYLGMMSDITKMKEHHTSLEKLAHYDALTGYLTGTCWEIGLIRLLLKQIEIMKCWRFAFWTWMTSNQ